MDTITWEFEGRCPNCDSEELSEYDTDTHTVTVCKDCHHEFMVLLNINEAIFY